MLRRLALVLLASLTLTGCDRLLDARGGIAAPIDDSGAYLLLEVNAGSVADGLRAQTVEVLQRRAQPFGLSVAPHGGTRIVVRSATAAFPESARVALTTTAQLDFHMVRELSREEAAAGRVPIGFMVVQPYPGVGSSIEVVAERPSIRGSRIADARPSTNQYTGEFQIGFEFDGEGARQFCTLTTEHVRTRFALLLDNQVLTAPMIAEPICCGSGQITGNFTAEFANNLAAIVRAGALPAPVTVIAEGVGPLAATP